jgi:hypothetical protein
MQTSDSIAIMSFYFDSDDEGDVGDNSFVCPNCGSTQSYADDSGHLFCSLCFSQSQTQPNEAEFEYDEVQALVARGRGGQMMGVTYAGGGRNRERHRTRLPMDSYDVSRPLPSLEECLQAYTAIIQACLESACTILELNHRQSDMVKNSVRQMWLAFLQSWQDGAEFYKKYHPEVRISLRDCFLSRTHHKSNVFRVLTNRAVERIKKEREDTSDSSSESSSDRDSHTEGSSDDEGESSQASESDEKERANKSTTKAVATLSSMLDLYRRKGRMEAALRLSPSMSMVASLLLTRLCKLGVSAPHIAKWIGTGMIPLLNAYKMVLNDELQYKVEPIAHAFRMDRVPTTERIEFQANLLFIAASETPVLIPPVSVPLLTARLVSDLNLEPRILNVALALLGTKPHTITDEWLPVALKKLHPIKSRAHILAAIAVACKLQPGLESQKYRWDHGGVVPWNDEQVSDVTNPLEYVAFVEAHILDGRPVANKRVHPDFLENSHSVTRVHTKKRKRSDLPVMAGEPNPRQPSMKRLQKYHEWRVMLKKRKAIWADANGLEHYMVYRRHSKLEHLHPHYQVLLEVMSLVADVKAKAIHRIVCSLDREIHYLCRPWEEPGESWPQKKVGIRTKTTRATNASEYQKLEIEDKAETTDRSSEGSSDSSSETDGSYALL